MTEEKGLLAALDCPFCGATMKPTTDNEGEFWMHPGFVTDGECFMSGKGIMPRQLVLWNTRPAAPASAVEALREAAASLMREMFENVPGLEADASWADTVQRGEDDSYPIVQAFARFKAETLECAAKVADTQGLMTHGCDDMYAAGIISASEAIATAIRQLKGSGDV